MSLRHLTSSDSICRPTFSLALISIIFDAISFNLHWLEPFCQLSRPVEHLKNSHLSFSVFVPVSRDTYGLRILHWIINVLEMLVEFCMWNNVYSSQSIRSSSIISCKWWSRDATVMGKWLLKRASLSWCHCCVPHTTFYKLESNMAHITSPCSLLQNKV